MKKKLLFLIFVVLLTPTSITKITFEPIIERFESNINLEKPNISFDSIASSKQQLSITNVQNTQIDQNSAEETPVPHPKMYTGLYQTYTATSGNASTLQKGEVLSASSYTEWETFSRVPVSEGNVNWYDLKELVGDEDEQSLTLASNRFMIKFVPEKDTNYMAFSFNLSSITQTPSSGKFDFYLTQNTSEYQSDYMMKFEIADSTYMFHQNNPDSPLMFVFWDHEITDQVSNVLNKNDNYYIIIESTNTFQIQASNDTLGTNENRVYIDNSGNWEEQIGIDAQVSVYMGNKISTEIVNSSGETAILYDTNAITGKNHRIVSSYYDPDYMYDISSDFLDVKIEDPSAVENITLTSPSMGEYGDHIDITADVINIYGQPLENRDVDFFYSNDNSSWIFLDNGTTNEAGIAQTQYLVSNASGFIYFKAVSEEKIDYASSEMTKEQVIVNLPLIESKYGSYSGYSDLESFYLYGQIVDNDGTPIEGVTAFFYRLNYPLFDSCISNETGWIKTQIHVVDWNAGYYSNAYWAVIDPDSTYYEYTETTYGDIQITKNNAHYNGPVEINGSWNEDVELVFSVQDDEGDAITDFNYELIIDPDYSESNISLGIFSTNSSGFGNNIITAETIKPGNHILYIKSSDNNYTPVEFSVNLVLTTDKLKLEYTENQSDDYIYNSKLIYEIKVTNSMGSPLQGINVAIYVSYPNNFLLVEDIYYKATNETGYARFEIYLDMGVGDQIHIEIAALDYLEDGVVLYQQSDSVHRYLTCIAAPSSFENLTDINCTNQETISINGTLLSDGQPIANQSIVIRIEGNNYTVYTDETGYFSLDYIVERGGTITVEIIYDSSDIFDNLYETIILFSESSQINIETSNMEILPNETVEFIATITSIFGTTPEGVSVDFYIYNEGWQLLGTEVTNSSGIAVLSISINLDPIETMWKAQVQEGDDWIGNENQSLLKIGLYTTMTIIFNENGTYMMNTNIMVEVKDEFGSPIIVSLGFYLDGVLIGTADTNSSGIAVLLWDSSFQPDVYNLKIELVGQSPYFDNEVLSVFEIYKAESYLQAQDIFLLYGEGKTSYIYLYSHIGGLGNKELNITIDGIFSELIFTNGSGYAEWSVPLLDSDTYIVNISYMGSNFYLSCALAITLQVDLMPTDLSMNAPNAYYLETYSITGYFEDNYGQPLENKEIKLYINGSYIESTLSAVDGSYSFEINLLPRVYEIEIRFDVTSNYQGASNTKIITIWKLETSIQGTATFDANKLLITATLVDKDSSPLSSKEIKFYLNGTFLGTNQTDNNGVAYFTVEDVLPGVYTIEIVFEGSDVHESSSQVIVGEQDKLQTELEINIFEGIYGSVDTIIQGKLTSFGSPLVNYELQFIIDSQTYYALTNDTGYAIIVLDFTYDAGNYIADISFIGDEVYSAIADYQQFSITKAESIINMEIEYRDNIPWLTGNLEGTDILPWQTIIINVNGSFYVSTSTDHIGYFEVIIELNSGYYELEAVYAGNGNHMPCSKAISLTISKTATVISSDNSINQVYNNEIEFIIQLTDINSNPLQNSEIAVTIDGSYYATVYTNDTGHAAIIIPDALSVDSHIMHIQYNGDLDYYQSAKDVTIKTAYGLEITELEINSGEYGVEGQIVGKVKNYMGDYTQITVELDLGTIIASTNLDANGYFSFNLDQYTGAGFYEGSLSISETEDYYALLVDISFTREKGVMDIEFPETVQVWNDLENISSQILHGETPMENIEINITVNGIVIEGILSDEFGMFIIPLESLSLNPGTYQLTIQAISSNSNIASMEQIVQLEILKDEININYTVENLVVGAETIVTANVTNNKGILLPNYTLEIIVNGEVYEIITDENGQIVFIHSFTSSGIIEIEISCDETLYYSAFNELYSVDVQKADVEIEVEQTIYEFNSQDDLAIKLKSVTEIDISNTTTLTILIGNDNYTLITVDGENFYLKLENINVGNYSCLIYFEGDENHNPHLYEFELVIQKQNTTLEYEIHSYKIFVNLSDSNQNGMNSEELLVEFYDSNGVLLNSLIYLTDENGTITIDLYEVTSETLSYLEISYRGNTNHKNCELRINLTNDQLPPKASNKLSENTKLIIEASVSILGLVGLLSLRPLLSKKKA